LAKGDRGIFELLTLMHRNLRSKSLFAWMKIPLHILKTWQKIKAFPIKVLSISIFGVARNPIEI
jgi:hypothetical protein